MYQNSRLDYLRQQALQAKMALQPMDTQMGGAGQGMPYNPQLNNQPVQAMMKPKYLSNMKGMSGNANLYAGGIRGYQGGFIQ